MEKKILNKIELMELRTDHYVTQGKNNKYESDFPQLAFKKLYILEQLMNQGSCVIFPVPLGEAVYSYEIENGQHQLHTTTVTMENGSKIAAQWETKYFPTQKAAEHHLLYDIAPNSIIAVSHDRKLWEYRYVHSVNLESTYPVTTYPHGWNQDIYEMYLEHGSDVSLPKWKYFAKVDGNDEER